MRTSRLALGAGLLLMLAGCRPPEETRIKVIIGATLIDGAGSPPLSDSVVLIVGSRIRAVGPRPNVPIPAGSEKLDGRGKFLVPALVELRESAGLRRIATLDEMKKGVDEGADAFLGMITDSAEITPEFAARLRALEVVFAPALVEMEGAGEKFERALRNTRRLADYGVPIGLAAGANEAKTQRELELLAQAGLSPAQVLAAGTYNGALALGKKGRVGVIAPNAEADLLLLGANPLEDVRNLRRVERAMRAGEWLEVEAAAR